MKAEGTGYASLVELLNNWDLAYAFKKKRLRYLRSASVSREVLSLRDNFNAIWDKRGSLWYLKDTAISRQGREILHGLLGDVDSATAILKINQQLAALDKKMIADFFQLHIASKKALKNLYHIFADGKESLVGLAESQILYFEKYLPTMKKFSGKELSDMAVSQDDLDNILHFLSKYDVIEQNLASDVQRFKEFERDFSRLYREDAEINIVGYGEISTVMRLNKKRRIGSDIVSNESKWIWKKMPAFSTKEEVDRFLYLYNEYRKILTGNIGINVPVQTARFFKHDTYYQVYAGQERVRDESVCNVLIKKFDERIANNLLRLILKKIRDVYFFNKTNCIMAIGIDAQLSNWALISMDGASSAESGVDDIIYLDTSSPMIRIQEVEQINPEIFIKSAASFLRPVIRRFFLQQVLDRYYDSRSVIIDIIANLHKEKREDLINSFIKTANEFFITSNIDAVEITRKEIDAYYSNDAFIWKFYQASRKIDRFITENILKKKYMFRIPEKIER